MTGTATLGGLNGLIGIFLGYHIIKINYEIINAFCFFLFLGTATARSPAFWVSLTSTLLRQLGKPSSANSAAFFNIVQKGVGGQTHVQNFCYKYSIILKGFLATQKWHERLFLHFSTDLHIILLNFVTTDVDALFKKSLKKLQHTCSKRFRKWPYCHYFQVRGSWRGSKVHILEMVVSIKTWT